MDFKTFIITKLTKYSYLYEQDYITTLNNIIYTICLRLLLLMTQLTNHCHKKVIQKSSVIFAVKIELKDIVYSSLTQNSIIPTHFLEDIFRSKIISTFSIRKDCLFELSNFLDFLIDYFIERSYQDNQLSIPHLLNILKKNNLFLYRFIVSKYRLKEHVTIFF